jgi:hypothetical protein
MIFTARQLQDLHNGDGQIVLPYGARLTPLAADWIRAKRLSVGYAPPEMVQASFPAATKRPSPQSSPGVPGEGAKAAAGAILWWSDGPCGPAKAAIAAQSRESALAAIDLPAEPTQLVPAIKHLAAQAKSTSCAGGILLVKSAAEAIVYANRCSSLRAVVGTCLESVDQAMNAIAPNVLILEYPYKSLPQIRNLLSRFARGPRIPGEQVQHRLKELASCA